MSVRFAVSIFSSVMLLSACGAWQSVSDASSSAYRAVFFKQVNVLNVDLSAREALNRDDAGRATSVAVRVYQLRDRKMDLQADLAAVLNSGASASLTQPMQADTHYVAVVAFYRNPGNGDGWKYAIEKKKLDADKPLKLELVDRLLLVSGAPRNTSR
ncbi:type VI secretion system lipoprotein TssJ [Burkholderia latens]|uniref:type VI secretion system lipoprotein TssJ n=1 Tax=Burkholderia latens TaxID=488446 RepID=UPI00158964C4|nr:type VI secretion system lipoprotein TssJ [Burkholderia latens]